MTYAKFFAIGFTALACAVVAWAGLHWGMMGIAYVCFGVLMFCLCYAFLALVYGMLYDIIEDRIERGKR